MDDYYRLGDYSRPITSASADAQRWFDRGLLWYYGFNREEARRCFERAAAYDTNCAMAWWGIAASSGMEYNKRWEDFAEDELATAVARARQATQAALDKLKGVSPVEEALVRSLEQRFQSHAAASMEELHRWNDAYAATIRGIHAEFSDDPDIVALFAEALMNRTPWQLWDLEQSTPALGADTEEAISVLEKGMALRTGATHPGIAHYYIHALEMSPWPERAGPACDVLRNMATDAGHFLHMPSHIDVLCGDYEAALVANQRAVVVDRKYLEREGALNFYTLSRTHDIHFKLYAAMFLGRYAAAVEAADEMRATITDELLRITTPPMADWLEGFVGMKVHALVRFGRWEELIAEPFPQDPGLYCSTTALLHYGKAIALGALGDVHRAEEEEQRFARAVDSVPASRRIFNNTCRDILAIAAAMLRGEIEYRKGNYDVAFGSLRQAIDLSDRLPYDEPWGWMQPVRHALGALLLEQGRHAEAAPVYRADLGLDNSIRRPMQHPNNVWSLHGYVECLHRLGEHNEAAVMQRRLDRATGNADVAIGASCFCRVGRQ